MAWHRASNFQGHGQLATRIAEALCQIDQKSRSINTTALLPPHMKVSFCEFYMKPNSRYSLVRILPAPSSKSAPTMSFFLNIFKCKPSSRLSLQSCALFVHNFPRSRPAPAVTEILRRRPQEPHYPKKIQVFAPESVFIREFTRFRTVTLPNSLMVVGWHDDVALTMAIARNSEVFQLNVLWIPLIINIIFINYKYTLYSPHVWSDLN